MKLGLGTVQFGLDYGVSNPAKRTPFEEAVEILRVAASNGVRLLDTAPSYGASEEVLGLAVPDAEQFRVVTKTHPHVTEPETLRQDLRKSLRKLRRESVYGLLMHRPDDLLGPAGPELYRELQSLKDQGLVQKIGVSIYRAEEIDKILDLYVVDLVQLPVNIFDQRLIVSGHLSMLKDKGIELHARSVFLQGLLLMNPEDLKPPLMGLQSPLKAFLVSAAQAGMTAVQAALKFVLEIAEIDTVLVGVNTASQLQQLLGAAAQQSRPLNWPEFAVQDKRLLNPAEWPGLSKVIEATA